MEDCGWKLGNKLKEMNKKLEILYPRVEAKIVRRENPLKSKILKEISDIKNSPIYKRYLELQNKLHEASISESRFICAKCGHEEKTKNLTLYNFISYSNTMDNDRYEDYNIICPKCGCFNFLRKDIRGPFKKTEEIYE